MDIDDLRAVQSKERRKDSLQHLRDSFYDDVAAYIASRRDRRDERAAAVDKPFSDSEIRKLSDEIETAEEVAESLYERRVGKVVKLASFAAADAPVDTEGMTSQELDLFEDLVARIRENKETVLDVLADGPGAAADDDAETGPSEVPGASDASGTGGTDPERAAPTDVAESSPVPGRGADDGSADADPAPADGGGVLADAMGGDDGAADATDGVDAGAAADAAPDAGTAGDAPGESAPEASGTGETNPATSDRAGTADRTEPGGATPSDTAPRSDGSTPPDAAASTGSDDDGRSVPPDEAGSDGDAGPSEAPDAADAVPAGATAGASGADAERDRRTAADGTDDAGSGVAADRSADATDGLDDRTTVRITRDVGRILGVDEREYDLASEDVVSLPAANAGPLVDRDAAEPVE